MNRIAIKVCGMRDSENIHRLAELNPDLMGFVFYPASARYAGEIPPERMFESFPPDILRTGVFVNDDLYSIKAYILRYRLQAVQLHGNETEVLCENLKADGMKVIKAFSIGEHTDFSTMTRFVNCTDYFLFDTATKMAGGSGKKFNWDMLDTYKLAHPFFLSGGIGPGDALKIRKLKHTALAGVDINSRFETEPGIKDIEKVKEFIRTIRG